MSGEWDAVDGASPAESASASGLVAAYAQWHLERGIRSLAHVSTGTTPPRGEGGAR
jgi:DNA repair protein RecO (recombination protein O)